MPAATSTSSTRTSSAKTTRTPVTSIRPGRRSPVAAGDAVTTVLKPPTGGAPASAAPTTPAAPPPARAMQASRFTLSWRIFLGTAAVVAVVLAATLAVASYVAGRNADQAVQAGLEQTNELVSAMLKQQRASMLGMATLFSEQPSFRSQVHPMTDTSDRTMLDQSRTAADLLGVTWVQIFDADGMRLAKSDDSTAKPLDLSSSLLVSKPLESGEHGEGFVVNDTTKLLQAVSVPINGAGGA